MKWRVAVTTLALLASSCSAPREKQRATAVAESGHAKGHDVAFFEGLLHHPKQSIPPGDSAYDLALELTEFLGSPDPKVRDDLAFSLLERWLRGFLLQPGEVERLTRTWCKNLERGIGESGTDSVFTRSFSALVLSIVAREDCNNAGLLGAASVQRLLDAATSYLARERDLRGWSRENGWIHATAHTADLLRWLARSHKLGPEGRAHILAAIEERCRTADVVFAWGEDERLSRALEELARRSDFDHAALQAWLQRFRGASSYVSGSAQLPVPDFIAVQNARHVLTGLFAKLSRDARLEADPDSRDRLGHGADLLRDGLEGR